MYFLDKKMNIKIASLLIKPTFHKYHLVDPSPWPFFTAFSAFMFLGGFVMYMHRIKYGICIYTTGLYILIFNVILWWRDVIREATFEGQHTNLVQKGLHIAFLLFILSEVMFFMGFFWAFFHASIAPSFNIGGIWPPTGINVINPWFVPLLNTFILLTSGATLTWSHHSVKTGSLNDSLFPLLLTIILACIFTGFQLEEYTSADFSIADSIYGSTFFMITGFHGFHVIIGTIFLILCFFRLKQKHFTRTQHNGFLFAIWYWHFVDIVWLFVFSSIYWWGS